MIRVENLPVSVFEAGSGMPIVGRGTLVQGRLEVVLHDGRVVGFDLGQVDLIRNDVRAARRISDNIQPSEMAYSPRFRALFASTR